MHGYQQRVVGPAVRRPVAVRHRGPGSGPVGELAGAAGNAATARWVRGQQPVVQRHSSWEHALMGDARPGELAAAVGRLTSPARHHVLEQELRRARFFKNDPRAVPDTSPGGLFDGLRVLRLAGSGLAVTYGEINALADYLPNGAQINAMTAPQLIPILQFMRQEIADACGQAMRSGDVDGSRDRTGGDWAGAQPPGLGGAAAGLFSRPGATVITEEAATGSRGFQSYTGLLSRNACHFAPLSWERYAQNHTRALQSALEAHAARAAGGDATAPETQAWVHNGYADHFLEDSFAAGHLINKTMIMQWFMEYARSRKPLPTKIQMPTADLVRAMGSGAQQHLAGQDMYELMDRAQEQHRDGGTRRPASDSMPTDPQTASEVRTAGVTPEDRAALAGVRPVPGMTERQVAHQYQLFLSNAFLQLAASSVHDHFNALTSGGLLVENGLGRRFRVGGDDTQLLLSDAEGAQVVVDAVTLSRRSIEETIRTGRSSVPGAEVLLHVPTKVILDSGAVGLREWNETVVRAYCQRLFAEVYDSVSANLVRRLGPLPERPDPDLAATR